jgi:PqqD family protein of HPr-rel-A system
VIHRLARYRASTALVWRSWGEDAVVVYHRESADVHLLDSLAAEMLRSLETCPATPSELVSQLAASTRLAPDDDVIRYIDKLLDELEELGLVEPLPP